MNIILYPSLTERPAKPASRVAWFSCFFGSYQARLELEARFDFKLKPTFTSVLARLGPRKCGKTSWAGSFADTI